MATLRSWRRRFSPDMRPFFGTDRAEAWRTAGIISK
jgi:hypothetical protein